MLAMLFSLAFVIYTRFSSDLQSAKSCKDQEREVREALSRMDIDSSKATVVYDEAESGTKVYRDEFERLNAMMKSGQIGILAVDDQSLDAHRVGVLLGQRVRVYYGPGLHGRPLYLDRRRNRH